MSSHADADRWTADRWTATHHGVVTRDRARLLGMTDRRVDLLVESGDWVRVHRGVFVAAASPATPQRALLAAVAAGGSGSVASHLSAAWLLDLCDRPAEPWVTVPRSRRRRIPGARVHRSAPSRAVLVDGIPCTPLHRTLVDCAAARGSGAGVLAGIVERALTRRHLDVDELVDELVAEVRTSPHRPGSAALLAHLSGI